MSELRAAIAGLRKAVQDLDRPGVSLGKPIDRGAVRWLATKLGFALPSAYIDLLATHDGATIVDPVYFSFMASLDVLVIHRREWADPARFWPLTGDGSGNYHCLDLTRSNGSDSPVVCFDAMTSWEEPESQSAATLAEFLDAEVRARLGAGLPPE